LAANTKLILNTSLLYQWGYQLSEFFIPNCQIDSKLSAIAKIRSKSAFRFLPLPRSSYFEKDFHYNESLMTKKSVKNFHGYFQSWKYFSGHLDAIREILKNSSFERSAAYAELFRDFEQNKVVAIHVRRGDYVGLESYHGLVHEPYYKSALNLALSEFPRAKIAVFSDDIVQAKKIVGNADYLIDNSLLPSPVETMLLMSHANSIIGANSSFSLWAGYLSDESNFNIYPRKWFTNPIYRIDDLLLPSFHAIGGHQ
jgi:hypothetical protein